MALQSIILGYFAYDIYTSLFVTNGGIFAAGGGIAPPSSSTTTANMPTAVAPPAEPNNNSARGVPVKSTRSATKAATTPRSPTRSISSKVQKIG